MRIRIYNDKPVEYWSESKSQWLPVIGNIVILKEDGFYELEVLEKQTNE